MNHDGYDELIVSNAFLEGSSHPIFLVSSGDLGSLDVLDGHVNHTLDLVRIQEESNSWQFGNVRRGFTAPKHVIGTAVQLLSDSSLDVVIRSPSDFHDTGSVYVVPSAKFLSLDGLDGSEDGVIDYYRCVNNGDCLSIRSTEDEHGLGTSVEVLDNFFGGSEASLVVSTTTGQTRRNDREGIPMTYVLSASAIKSALNESEDSVLDVSEFNDRANTISIYPEQDVIDLADGRTVLMRLPDMDNDGRDDLVISLPNRDFVYVVMSGDINSADTADDETDRKVDLASIYEQTGSYRFSGFDYQTSQNTGHTSYGRSMPGSLPHYLTIRDGYTSYLVDVASLPGLDGEDGEVDGKISQVSPDRDSNVWRFPGIRSAFVCHDEDPMKSPRVVASTIEVPRARSIYGDVRMYSIEAAKLSELDDADGNPDGTINLNEALSEAPENQWQILFGELAQNLIGLHIGCAGDLDEDGAQDYSITLKQDLLFGMEYRTSIILLMDADLALIDELDGSKDNRLNVSLLWPEDYRQLP